MINKGRRKGKIQSKRIETNEQNTWGKWRQQREIYWFLFGKGMMIGDDKEY